MGKRKRLGLIFSYDDSWIGGTYYTINLVHALNLLPYNKKPEIIIFSNSHDFLQLQSETNYPFLSFNEFSNSNYSKIDKLINKISIKLFHRKAIIKKCKNEIDAFYIMQRSEFFESIPSEKRIYWIPDFQDKHFPQYFSKVDLDTKHKRNLWIHEHSKNLIFSSESVKRDWEEFYPNFKGKTSVVHFAVTHPKYDYLNIDEIRIKYNLPNDYFFAPNQFWAHKNHMVVIKAAEMLKVQGKPIVIAFSGKENDNRNPGYTESLKDYVLNKNLGDVVRFLGFLDRREQLKIMKHSKAVIQPSIFEGWSSVIEDAMAMSKVILASDLNVNIEQLGDKGIYFDRNDYQSLSKKIFDLTHTEREYNYAEKQLKFAKEFINALDFD